MRRIIELYLGGLLAIIYCLGYVLVMSTLVGGIFLFFYEYESLTETAVIKNISLIKLLDRQYSQNRPVELLFAGDVMLSRYIGKLMLEKNDFKWPFLKIASATGEADVFFANLESPISNKGKNMGSEYSFRADPRSVEGLVFSGVDIVSLANNHILDWGPEALTDTISLLKQNNIQFVGAGRDENEANSFKIMHIRGKKIGFLAYTDLLPKGLEATTSNPGISRFNLEKIKMAIGLLKEKADLAVVSMHWGEEYQTRANENQKKLGRELIDAGADLVVGHHPHVAQEAEHYKGGWIAYSLGNFVFDQPFSREESAGLLLRVKMSNRIISEVTTSAVAISGAFEPELDE